MANNIRNRRNNCWNRKTRSQQVVVVVSFLAIVFVLVVIIWGFQQKGKESSEICWTSTCDKNGKEILSVMDLTKDPCQDFYEYVCGNFEKVYPLKPRTTINNQLTRLSDDLSMEQLAVIEDLDKKRESLPVAINNMVKLYKSCLDMTEESKWKYLQGLISSIGGFPMIQKDWEMKPNAKKMQDLIPWVQRVFGISVFLEMSTFPNIVNAQRFVLTLSKPAFASPYHDLQDDAASIRELACQLNTKCDELPNLKTDIEKLLRTMKNIDSIPITLKSTAWNLLFAKWKRESHYQIQGVPSIPNTAQMTVWELQQAWKKINNTNLNIVDFLRSFVVGTSVRIKSSTLILVDLSYLSGLFQMMAKMTNRELMNYFNFYWITQIFGDVHKVKTEFEKEVCVARVQKLMPFAMAAAYVQKYWKDHQKIKSEVTLLVKDIRKALEKIIDESKWLDMKSKKAMKTKLKNQGTCIGFPEWIFDDKKLNNFYQIKDSDFNNYLKTKNELVALYWKHDVEKHDTKLNKDNTWLDDNDMGFLEINAWNNIIRNSITIPVGILRFPFYDREEIRSWLYGAVGFVVAHEIMHSFDFSGIKWNEVGVFKQLLLKDMSAKYKEKGQCLIDQYSSTQIKNSTIMLQGNMTIDEDLSDNVGLAMAYNAYLDSSRWYDKKLAHLEQFSTKQHFFIFHTMPWCEVYSEKHLEEAVTYEHTLKKYRTLLTYKNFPQFNEAFNCPVGSPMNEPNKCTIF